MQVLLLVLLTAVSVRALDNGLARTPPMGWLDWERFRCNVDCEKDPEHCISERLFMEMADRIVADGYKDVGYEYVNIDDCWPAKSRDAKGRLVPDPKRFPNGIIGLAKYIHSKGLKLGIYEDFGTLTCGGYPGSEFYLQLDAQTFADWQVDLLKFDGCYSDPNDMKFGYPIMGKFLNLTGRPILYSCSWPAYIVGRDGIKLKANFSGFVENVGAIPPYKDIAHSCNTWRNYGDIQDSWDSVIDIIEFYGKDEGNFSHYAGPGNFNDPDMLIIGDFGLSLEQQKAQMAMWCLMASPLFMSNDLRKMPAASKAILQNIHAIRINQDPMGIQGKQVSQMGNVYLWTRPIMPNGTVAFVALNKGNDGTPARINVPVSNLGANPAGYNITEVFSQTPIGTFKPGQTIPLSVNPTGVVFAVATPLS